MTMPQLDQLSCPSCAEPLEEEDRFCQACGTDLKAALEHAGPSQDSASGGAAPPVGSAPWSSVPVPGPAAETPGHARSSASEEASDSADFTLPPARGAAAAASFAEAEAARPPGPDPRTADPRAVPDPREGAPSGGLQALVDQAGPPPGPAGEGAGSGPEALRQRCVACGTGAIDADGYCEHCGHKQPLERDHMEQELPALAAASDRGLRHHRNEDFFHISESAAPDGGRAAIAVVCDGVSSATRPDEASAAAARAAGSALEEAVSIGTHPQQAMHEALVTAAEAVNVLAEDGPLEPSKNAPACTIVAAVTLEGILTVGWVGDSRAYWVPDDRSAPAARLTEDDSWAAQMVAAGLMAEADAYADPRAHAITGWLGADAYELEPHTAAFRPETAGAVVVCTDGLWNYAESAEELTAAVPADAVDRPLHSAQHLVGYALDGGGHDNVTVAVVPFPPEEVGAGSA